MSRDASALISTGGCADEINRLHSEALRSAGESHGLLQVALLAAWKAGQLLLAEKRNVRRSMGPGAWVLWLERYFAGTPRTAQRYMLLAKSVSDVSAFTGMSLRQVYFRLGIATEPKLAARVPVRPIPRHLTLSMRLVTVLKMRRCDLAPEVLASYQRDLRPLYERLRMLFER